VHPIQRRLPELEIAYHQLIVSGEDTEFLPIGKVEAREAARLRGEYGLPLADAFQVAVALVAGAQAILTNDPIFKRVREIRALIVDELES
jgi:predicted nucleic acid-binding protein